MTTTLSKYDAGRVLDCLPEEVIRILKLTPTYLAGGCVRSVLNKEPVRDFDLFTCGPDTVTAIVKALDPTAKKTKSAYTLKKFNPVVQVIHREFFDTPEAVINSFDFTICKAVIWWGDDGDWHSLADEAFEPDVKERVLRYCVPGNNRAADSLVRALKFTSRGYDLIPSSLAKLVWTLSDGDTTEKDLCAQFSGSEDPAQWGEPIKNCGSSR